MYRPSGKVTEVHVHPRRVFLHYLPRTDHHSNSAQWGNTQHRPRMNQCKQEESWVQKPTVFYPRPARWDECRGSRLEVEAAAVLEPQPQGQLEHLVPQVTSGKSEPSLFWPALW